MFKSTAAWRDKKKSIDNSDEQLQGLGEVKPEGSIEN
jgi:hypothetical protein